MDFKEIEQQLNKLKAQHTSKVGKITLMPKESDSLEAFVDLRDNHVEIKLNPNWKPENLQQIQKLLKTRQISNPVQRVVKDTALHETGHVELKNKKGCPQDIFGKDICLDAVSKVLKENGKYSSQTAGYLSNAIEDILNNTNVHNFSSNDGLAIFLAEQGQSAGGKFTPFYEAFVKLNLYLWGNKLQKQAMSSFYTHDQKVNTAVQNFITDLGLEKNRERQTTMTALFDKEKWSEIFEKAATALVDLMEVPPIEDLPGSGGKGLGQKPSVNSDNENNSDADENTEENSDNKPAQPGEKPKDKTGKQVQANWPGKEADEKPKGFFDQKIRNPNELKKVLQKRFEEGKPSPEYLNKYNALDLLYQSLAGDIRVKADAMTKNNSFPIVALNYRPFDFENDDIQNANLGKILLNENGEITFGVARQFFEIKAKFIKKLQNYPSLNVMLLDESGSMQEGAKNSSDRGNTTFIPWGDKSKYHFGVLTWYGLLSHFQKLGIACDIKQQLITFAEKTKTTGEQDFSSLDLIKRKLLNPNFGNSTLIDLNVLKKIEEGSLLISISDGEIHNWNSISPDYRKIIADKFYVHFQIGDESIASAEIAEWNHPVINIQDASSMPKQVIEIADGFYQNLK